MSNENHGISNENDLRNPSGLPPLSDADLRDEVIKLARSPLGKHLRLFPFQYVYTSNKDSLQPRLGKWNDTNKLTNDPERIDELWQKFPRDAVATRCDELVIFDIDLLNDGKTSRIVPNPWVSTLSKEERDALNTGLQAKTSSGGSHFIFILSEAARKKSINSKTAIVEGIDLITGPKKILVLPPSYVEKRAKGYCGRHIFECRDSEALKAIELPTILLDLIIRLSTRSTKQTKHNSSSPAGLTELVPEGERREHLLKKSRFMRGRGLSMPDTTAALLGIRDRQCDPGSHPFTDEEVKGIARSTFNKFEPDDDVVSESLTILNVTEFKKIPPPSFLIKGVLPTGVTVVVADPGIGKSFLCLAIGSAIARNEPLFQDQNLVTNESGPVLFALPEAAASWASRVRAYDTHNFNDEDCPNMFFIKDGINLHNDTEWEKLLEAFHCIKSIAGKIPKLVVVDTLAAAMPGANENAIEDMGKVLNRLQLLVSLGSNVLISHHKNKSGVYRGHSSLAGSCENLLHLEKDSNTKVLELVAKKSRDFDGLSPCSFEIVSHSYGPVPIRSKEKGTWETFLESCNYNPGLLEAFLAHGLDVPSNELVEQVQLSFQTGTTARAVQSTWNKSIPPTDRAHRSKRQRDLLKTIRHLNNSQILFVEKGNLNSKESDALDVVLIQKSAS